jgi:hypothetical protein
MDFVRFSDPSQPAINALANDINAQAEAAKVPACALAAIVDNESGGQNILQVGFSPGPGAGVGVCQITYGVNWTDLDHPTYQGLDLWNPADNLKCAATYFLQPVIRNAMALQASDPTGFQVWGNGQVLWYAFASYNAGWGAVMAAYRGGRNPDSITTDSYATRAFAAFVDFTGASHQAGMTAP